MADDNFLYADLIAGQTGVIQRTSIKAHIDAVRRSGHQDVIKLVKLWSTRQGLGLSAFVIELAVAKALAPKAAKPIEEQLSACLNYFKEDFATDRLVDPTNPKNVISDGITVQHKRWIAAVAAACCAQQTWELVVW